MSYLQQNLAALALNQPRLAARLAQTEPAADCSLRPSRSGKPHLVRDGALMCSSVDPVDEGRRLAASAPSGRLLVLGFGLGYHLDPLARREIVVLEPDAARLRLALEARDLSALLPRLRLSLDIAGLGEVDGCSLMVHRPTARAHAGLAETLAARLQEPKAFAVRPRHPKVLVVSPVAGGSEPMARWCAQALSDLGCVVRRPVLEGVGPLYGRVRELGLGGAKADALVGPLMRFLGEMVLAEARDFEPHLVLALAQAPLELRTLAALGELGAMRAFWFVEDHRVRPYYQQVAPGYDHFFHLEDKEFSAHLAALGSQGHFLPLAAHPPRHRPMDPTPEQKQRFGAPLGFVGEGYPNRVRLFEHLVSSGLPLKVWGTGWPAHGPLAGRVGEKGRRLGSQEVALVYSSCPLVLNLHSSLEAGRGPGGSAHVNPRTLEAPACGALLLSDYAPGIERLLTVGSEMVLYESQEDLIDKARYYLGHPQELRALALAGRRRVLGEHTYRHRMESLLQTTLGSRAQDRQAQAKDHASQKMFEPLAA